MLPGGGSGDHRLSVLADQRPSRDRRRRRGRGFDSHHSQGPHVQPKLVRSARRRVGTGQIPGRRKLTFLVKKLIPVCPLTFNTTARSDEQVSLVNCSAN